MALPINTKRRLTPFQTIILGFAIVILTGAILLMLPISSKNGDATSFSDAVFTSTSAVCVTGLVVQDTATYWSAFGQTIILLLIQIGGLGVVTVASAFALLSGRKISLMQRSTIQEAVAAPKTGGMVRLIGFILRMTFILELAGALLMMPVFCKEFGLKGIWMAVFHSISAFCNAGFDIMGTESGPYASFTSYIGNPIINITVMLLIIIGGIGFLTWDDIRANKLNFKRYRMQSKVILTFTLVIIIVPAIFFFFVEFSDLSLKDRILASLFQSVTPRTAGFNTADLTAISQAGQMIIIMLMIIGGSPGSTAGGMKTTTIAVLLGNAFSVFRRKEFPHFFGRRIETNIIKNASTILLMYLTLFTLGGILISVIEDLPVLTCLFETASAIGTVGLSLGITTEVGTFSRIILMLLMFFGRVGGLTLIYAAISGVRKTHSKLPQEKITVG